MTKKKYPLDFCEHDVPIDEFCEICDDEDWDDAAEEIGGIFDLDDDNNDFDDETFYYGSPN